MRTIRFATKTQCNTSGEVQMKRRKRIGRCGCLVGVLLPLVAGAQTYHLTAGSLDGSGGPSTGGPYGLSGTAGQADAAQWGGGPYTLTAGFWMIAGMATRDGPQFEILMSGGGLTVRWPTGEESFDLQRITDLTSDSWQTVRGPYPESGGYHEVTLPSPTTHQMYRLEKQTP